MVPRLGWTASWPPSSLPIAHGDPTSPGAAVGLLLRPLRCTLPIGWIGGRYTTSNPISAIRGSAAVAVAKVPCTGFPSASQPPVERGNISYHEPKRASGRSTQTPNCSPRVTSSRSGNSSSSSSTSGDSASAVRVTGSPGRAQRRRGVQQRMALLARHSRRGALEQRGADQQIVGKLLFALARIQFGNQSVAPGVNRVTPAVDAEGPQSDPVGGELAVEDVRLQAHRHRKMLRLDPLLFGRTPAWSTRVGRPAPSRRPGPP